MQRIENRTFNDIMGWISNTKIGGIIPVDNVLHFFVGFSITIIFLKFKIKFWQTFTFLLLITLAKEYYDSFVLQSSINEHIEDILFSIAYPALLLIIRYARSKIAT